MLHLLGGGTIPCTGRLLFAGVAGSFRGAIPDDPVSGRGNA